MVYIRKRKLFEKMPLGDLLTTYVHKKVNGLWDDLEVHEKVLVERLNDIDDDIKKLENKSHTHYDSSC